MKMESPPIKDRGASSCATEVAWVAVDNIGFRRRLADPYPLSQQRSTGSGKLFVALAGLTKLAFMVTPWDARSELTGAETFKNRKRLLSQAVLTLPDGSCCTECVGGCHSPRGRCHSAKRCTYSTTCAVAQLRLSLRFRSRFYSLEKTSSLLT